MQISKIKTHIISANENLETIAEQYLSNLHEQDIIAVTSKIISLCEGQIIDKNILSKEEVVKREADKILLAQENPYGTILTIKNNRLLVAAGVDESNANDCYILHPKNSQDSAKKLWRILRKINNIKELGVIITDSTTTMMRKGVTGIALGWCGFKPLYSYIGEEDIFGRKLKVSEVNLVDSLATSAVLMMGEGNEMTPISIIKNAPKISFVSRIPNSEEEESLIITVDNDIYAPILINTKWV